MPRKLTSRQRKFIEVYAGNGTKAARLAGYRGTDNALAQAARALLRNPQISKAIRDREQQEVRPYVATRQERQQFWTRVMGDPKEEMAQRLRASELLGKSEADFSDKLQMTGKDGGPVQHQHVEDLDGYTDEELEAISAIHEARAARRAAQQGGGDGGAGEAPPGT